MNFSMGRSGFIPDENFRDRYPGHPYKSDLAKLPYNFHGRGSRVENLGQRTRGGGRRRGGIKKKEEEKRRSGRRFQTPDRDDEANQVTVAGVTCDATLNPEREEFPGNALATKRNCVCASNFQAWPNYIPCHGINSVEKIRKRR